MPLERYMDGGAHILPADESLIRFAMTDGQRVIGVELPIPLLQARFGQAGSGAEVPLDLFARNQAAIEAAASRAHDTIETPNDLMQMGPEDFEAAPA